MWLLSWPYVLKFRVVIILKNYALTNAAKFVHNTFYCFIIHVTWPADVYRTYISCDLKWDKFELYLIYGCLVDSML